MTHTAKPIRLAVQLERPFSKSHERAMAELLLRTNLRMEVVSERDSEVLIGGERGISLNDCFPGYSSPLEIIANALTQKNEAGMEVDEHERPLPENCPFLQNESGNLPFDNVNLRKRILQLAGREEEEESLQYPQVICLTFDIDSSGMYFGRNLIRNLRTIFQNHRVKMQGALGQALLSRIYPPHDPHLCVREIAESLEGLDVPVSFFVQTHQAHPLDNYDLGKCPSLVHQLKQILRNDFHEAGLHSSYATMDSPNPRRFVCQQWKRLHRCLGDGISAIHRAHYLRAAPDLPYRSPFHREPTVDSSLGFGGRSGYRFGTAFPFACRNVIEAPPAVMDSTLHYFEGLDADSARERIESLRPGAGIYTLIFHPNNMDSIIWPGWKEMLFDFVLEAKRNGKTFLPIGNAARMMHERRVQLQRELSGALNR